MGRNIKRAKVELKEEAHSSEVWSWPKTQNKHKEVFCREQESSHRLLEPGEQNLIPVFLQLGQ
eukprot:4685971-Prorocentrum_lima.AAC.1